VKDDADWVVQHEYIAGFFSATHMCPWKELTGLFPRARKVLVKTGEAREAHAHSRLFVLTLVRWTCTG